jgi:acyl-CoA dehydrogenase
MDFSENPDHVAIAEAVRTLCAGFPDEYWRRCEGDHEFPWDFYRAMAKSGWVGIALPDKYGGGGQGIQEASIVLREVAASGAAMNGCSALHLTIFGLNPVVVFGSEELKQAFLPRAAAGELHVAFGVTEVDAGTDTSRVATRAEPDGHGGYVIHGQKVWTTKALESEVVLLLARTSGEPGSFKGLSLFLADLDRNYVDIRPIPKMGRNAVASCETHYDGLPVEGWRRIGEEGEGWRYLTHGLNPERVLIASEAIGIGEASLRRAVRYATDREVFKRPIGANQAISHPLAQAHVQLRAAWQLTQYAAWCYDSGLDSAEAANSAKYLAAEAGFFAADRAVQTLGGMGYAVEHDVERYFREARVMRIAPVSQEMTLNFIAQKVLGLPRSY